MTRVSFLIFLLLGCATCAQGQDSTPVKEKRKVRFLTVGDFPPFRQEIRDGVRYEMPPPPGSLPPAEISISQETKSPDPAASKPASVRLQLGKASETISLPAGTGTMNLLATGSAAGNEPWLRVPQPESGDFLVVIWRATRAKSWDQPKFIVVPDKHPAGKLTLLNVSPVTIAVACGSEKLLIESGKPHDCEMPGDRPIEFHIGTPTAGTEFKKMISMSLEQRQKEHTLAVMCLSDGEEPRQPLKLTLLKSPAVP